MVGGPAVVGLSLNNFSMMKKIMAFGLTLILGGCIFKDDRFVRKIVTDDSIKITWFYYSYISNTSPDVLVVKKGDMEQEIFRAEGVITDVNINGKIIAIKLFEPHNGLIYTKKEVRNAFEYRIDFDSSATVSDYWRIPDGVKE